MSIDRAMIMAYSDPPYLGCGKLYPEHPEAMIWDDSETYRLHINDLCIKYPDGWALSLSSTSLSVILPMCPSDVRIASWVKPFAAFKQNVRVAYTWEPVIFRGGRLSSQDGAMVNRDHLAEPIAMKKGLTGAKPERFCRWILDLLGWIPGDTIHDLFPGTGVFGDVLQLAIKNPNDLRGPRAARSRLEAERNFLAAELNSRVMP